MGVILNPYGKPRGGNWLYIPAVTIPQLTEKLTRGEDGAVDELGMTADLNFTSGSTRYANSYPSRHATDGSDTALGIELVGCELCRAGFAPRVIRIHATLLQGNLASCQNIESDFCRRATAVHILCVFNPKLA